MKIQNQNQVADEIHKIYARSAYPKGAVIGILQKWEDEIRADQSKKTRKTLLRKES